MKISRIALFASNALILLTGPLQAQEEDLSKLDLTTLMQMDVQVTSVSKKETRLGDAATAISVITPDDIRRLGITSIAEALRLVPGVNVARLTRVVTIDSACRSGCTG